MPCGFGFTGRQKRNVCFTKSSKRDNLWRHSMPRHTEVIYDLDRRLRKCCQCKEWKHFDLFATDKRKRHGITSNCLECRAERMRAWSRLNPEKRKAANHTPEQRRAWWSRTKEARNRYHRDWARNNRDKIARYARTARRRNPEMRLLSNLRGRLNDALKRHTASKDRPINLLLGCTIQELREHLESRFISGMSWDNYGLGADRWHIDHIIPCSSFDLTKPEEQRQCFHFSNLQPLWQPENLAKSKGGFRKIRAQ